MMNKKAVALWLSFAMVFGFIVALDVTTDFTMTVGGSNTFYVNETGTDGAYTRIQDAINASNDGDTVYVYRGIYNENVVVNKTINLTGEDRDTTIINGSGNGDVVLITVDWMNITGFTVTGSGSVGGDAGIELNNVQNCSIINNNVSSNNNYGIFLFYSDRNNITGNNASSNDVDGIYLSNSDRNNITGNNASSNNRGISLSNSDRNNITDNTVSSNLWDGIKIGNSNWNKVKGNNAVLNDGNGIYLEDSSANNIIGNNVSNSLYGIYLESSSGNNITGNNALDNLFGIRLRYSDGNNITGNTISSNNGPGIYLESSSGNNLTGNIVSNNADGIYLSGSSGNNITCNTISSNDEHGIRLFSSDQNTIANNTISSNTKHSIYLKDSSSNLIYHNDIINNAIQAYDNMDSNFWNDTYPSCGNFWSDYSGIDLNCTPTLDVPPPDGIGDTPYIIDSDSQDNYPLMVPFRESGPPEDTTPPTISMVFVIDITESSATVTWVTDELSDSRVNWSIYPDLSDNYTIYDPILMTSHSISIISLSPNQTYYFEVTSVDADGNSTTDNNGSQYHRFTTLSSETILPMITLVSVTIITEDSAAIIWITNVPTDSRVNWSIYPDLSDNSTTYNPRLTTSHSIALTSLSPNQTYYFEVTSVDADGNSTTDNNGSQYHRFTTLSSETILPMITLVSMIGITENSANIIWITNVPTDSRVNWSIYSDLSDNSTIYNPRLTTSHSIALISLSPNQTYYFEVMSVDVDGNSITDNNGSQYYMFITLPHTSSRDDRPAKSFFEEYWWRILIIAAIVLVLVLLQLLLSKKKGEIAKKEGIEGVKPEATEKESTRSSLPPPEIPEQPPQPPPQQ